MDGRLAQPPPPPQPTLGSSVDAVVWYLGYGETSRLIRDFDWASTSLGPLDSWSTALLGAVSVCMCSRFPMSLWLGPDYRLIYNDAHVPLMGSKHPAALCETGRAGFPELWHIIGPELESVVRTGNAILSNDKFYAMDRHGYLEEAFFTLCDSPIRGPNGTVIGVFTCIEDGTERFVSSRRLQTLRDLSVHTANAADVHEAGRLSTQVLARNVYDVPCAMLYSLAPEGAAGSPLRLDFAVGVPDEALRRLTTESSDFFDALRGVVVSRKRSVVPLSAGIQALLPHVKHGECNLGAPREVLMLPVVCNSENCGEAHCVLVLGLHPGRALDKPYRAFCKLVASQLSSAMMLARDRATQRQRAEELAAVDRAKTAFFQNVSHELRTPLTLMVGPLEEALRDSSPDSPTREFLTMAHNNAVRLLKLTNMLLDVSRIEAGRMQATYRRVNIARVTADLTSVFRAACDKAGLRLEFLCKKPLRDDVYVDLEMWEKIVLNLLSNAFKFTLEDGIKVELTENVSGDGIRVEVRDTGCGIPAHELPRIFERFHRIEGSRARTHEGTGIGLALVYELVRLQGGTISAESIENRGSTFTVSLPYGYAHLPHDRIQTALAPADTFTLEARDLDQWTAETDALLLADALKETSAVSAEASDTALAASSSSSPSSSSTSVAALNRARVMVVDDNADMRRYLRRLLSTAYAVHTATDGHAALAELQAAVTAEKEGAPALPELIVCDVMMPGLDGLGLVRALRHSEAAALRDVPVLLLSARAGAEAAAGGLEAGADDYVVKPFLARELLARVAGRIELARHRKAAARQEAVLREEAERANAAKDRFLAVLSHELRTPLTPTLYLAEGIAADESLHPSVRADADLIARNTRLEVELISDLLDITKIREQKLVLDAQHVSVHQLLAHTRRLVQSSADTKHIQLEWHLRAERDVVIGDATRLQQVFWNLLGNAVKFTLEGGRIEVQSKVVGDAIQVSVCDNGRGIAVEVLPRLFTAFEQGSADVTRSFGGLGLGLSIAHAILRMHHGSLSAASEGEGRGAQFIALLPLAANAASVPPAVPSMELSADAVSKALSSARVLLVEDNVPTAMVLQRLLGKMHCSVRVAASVAEALSLMRAAEFDVLVCDVGLPDGSGLVVVAAMRATKAACAVVALSGYGTAEDVRRSVEAGAHVHLTKPVRSAELTATIAGLLGHKA